MLWLTINRSFKVAQHFGYFQKEVSKIAQVTFIVRYLNGILPGKYCEGLLKEKIKVQPYDFSCEGYDFIFTDAFFAFACQDWKDIKTPKGIMFEDMHGSFVKEHVRLALKYGADMIFHRYPDFLKFHPAIGI